MDGMDGLADYLVGLVAAVGAGYLLAILAGVVRMVG